MTRNPASRLDRGVARALLIQDVMMRQLAAAAGVLATLALGGCAMFMHTVEKPRVDVTDVALSSASFTGIDGQVSLDVSNPNSVGVPLSGIDWQLTVGGAT